MIVISALEVAVDYTFIRRVLHLNASSDMVNYDQESDRANRDGLYTVSLILLPRRWSVSWNANYRSDFLTEDCKQMTRYLQSQQCLRYLLTAYLNDWIDARLGVTYSEDGARCSFYARASKTIHATARSVGEITRNAAVVDSSQANSRALTPVSTPNTVTNTTVSNALKNTDNVDDKASSSDDKALSSNYNSNPMQSTMSDQDLNFMQLERDEQDIYDVANNLSHATTIQIQTAFNLYETRINRWDHICIPCSFTQTVRVDGSHPDYLRELHAVSLQDLRVKIQFARYIAYWTCDQPQYIYFNRERDNCKQPDLLWHVCWTACSLDTKYKSSIIQSLRGPQVDIDLDIRRKARYLKWLREKSSLFTLPTSNAARLIY